MATIWTWNELVCNIEVQLPRCTCISKRILRLIGVDISWVCTLSRRVVVIRTPEKSDQGRWTLWQDWNSRRWIASHRIKLVKNDQLITLHQKTIILYQNMWGSMWYLFSLTNWNCLFGLFQTKWQIMHTLVSCPGPTLSDPALSCRPDPALSCRPDPTFSHGKGSGAHWVLSWSCAESAVSVLNKQMLGFHDVAYLIG